MNSLSCKITLNYTSLFNDFTNVNDMIKKLIDVAELLYGKIDSLLDENGKN